MDCRDDTTLADTFIEVVLEHASDRGLQALREAFGGTEFRIPRKVDKDHRLSELLGFEAAQAVCAAMCVTDADGHSVGNLRVMLPLGAASSEKRMLARLDALLIAGTQSVRSIAVAAGCHERTAWRRRKLLIAQKRIKSPARPEPSGRATHAATAGAGR